MKPEIKTFSFKVDNVDSKGTITGYASTFGNVDLGSDVVDKGAFKKTIKEGGVNWPILADHDPRNQIGFNLRAQEDSKGLAIEGKLDLNIQKAREKFSLAKTAFDIGADMGLSIGYMTIKAEPDKKTPMVRHLKELKMFEYSMVTFPMNTEALVEAAKSMGFDDKIKNIMAQLKENDISLKDLEEALQREAAKVDHDPTKLGQSMDTLLDIFRN